MDFCHSEKKLVLIFEVLNLEKLFKVFSICWFVLGVWPRPELWIYQKRDVQQQFWQWKQHLEDSLL